MSRTKWAIPELDERGVDFPAAYALAIQHICENPGTKSVVVQEIRPARLSDVDLDDVTQRVLASLDSYFYDHPKFNTQNGSAELREERVPDYVLRWFQTALRELLVWGLDFTAAQGQPTGVFATVTEILDDE